MKDIVSCPAWEGAASKWPICRVSDGFVGALRAVSGASLVTYGRPMGDPRATGGDFRLTRCDPAVTDPEALPDMTPSLALSPLPCVVRRALRLERRSRYDVNVASREVRCLHRTDN